MTSNKIYLLLAITGIAFYLYIRSKKKKQPGSVLNATYTADPSAEPITDLEAEIS